MTKVVNLYKDKYDVYIGRPGKGKEGYFGNPFALKPNETRDATIARYKEYFDNRILNDPEFKERVLELKDKTLGCFCKPHACHGDIIDDYLNNQ